MDNEMFAKIIAYANTPTKAFLRWKFSEEITPASLSCAFRHINLSGREQLVMINRFKNNLKWHDVGLVVGCSHIRAHQIAKRVIKKLVLFTENHFNSE